MQALLARETEACESYLDADTRANMQQLLVRNSPELDPDVFSIRRVMALPRKISSNFSEIVALLQQSEIAATRADVSAVPCVSSAHVARTQLTHTPMPDMGCKP